MSSLRTFIVEDSPVIRENLTAALEELGPVRVIGCAEDEAGAIGWLRRCKDDCELVIVDLFLKQGSGLGVLAAARRLGGGPSLVVLSNHATPEMRRRCLALGADRVFDKSNDIDSLIDYCELLASGRRG
ncbi:response regulator [Quisquiliibacterium transsilvanicum]|uniref:DNA-binding NarL/FixJ family response regulator n=1 Tax=Quisquiliibacterium transsilvanicum TaxID=1549638 RepID=A0A7W8HI80_9BURK|nr:DNA-binding NarL/FixJ family response regulator [Quisquiliibacterium transsilvanicum]